MVAINENILFVFGAWLFWGTYPVPFKSKAAAKANIDPFVFQCMKSLCVCITSWLILTWKPFYFTHWGFVGAALWVPAGLFFITSVKLTGVAFATPVANGIQVIVSFCWGAFYFHEPVKNAGLSVLAMAIMIAGMVGISYSVNYEKLMKSAPPELPVSIGVSAGVNYEKSASPDPRKKDGADEYTPIIDKDAPPPVPKAVALRNTVLGLIFAAGVGFFGGSMNVPLKHAPPEAHGISYIISFGIGSVVIAAGLTAIYVGIRYALKLGPPIVNLRVSLLPGTAAGCLWAAGNVCQIYATLELGQTVGFPLVMCNMMVAGFWGVFFYNEAPRVSMKGLFIASCLVLLGGVTLLSVYG